MTAHFVHLLEELRRRSLRMASLVEDMVQEACEAVLAGDEALARRVINRDCDVDAEEVEVESEVIRLLALYQPVGSDLRLLCTILKVNNDLERIADCAVNIAERARYLSREALGRHRAELERMAPMVRRMLRTAIQAYSTENPEIGLKVFDDENVVDALYEEVVRGIVSHGAQSPDAMAGYLDLLSVAKNLERAADHANNITEDVVFLSSGEIVRHRERNEITQKTPPKSR